jgi:chromosome segregation ATPase
LEKTKEELEKTKNNFEIQRINCDREHEVNKTLISANNVLKNEINELQNRINKLTINIREEREEEEREKEQDIESKNNEITQLKNEQELYQQQSINFEAELRTKTFDLEQLTIKYNNLEKENNGIKIKNDILNKTLVQLTEEKDKQQQKLEISNKKYNELYGLMLQLKEKVEKGEEKLLLNEYLEKITLMEEQITELEQQINSDNEQLKSKDKEIKTLNTLNKEIKTENEQINKTCQIIQDSNGDLEKQIEILNNRIVSMMNENNQLIADIEISKKSFTSLSNINNNLTETLEKKETEIKGFEQLIDNLKNTINELEQGKLTSGETIIKIQNLGKENEQLKQQIETLKQTIKTSKETISKFKEDYDRILANNKQLLISFDKDRKELTNKIIEKDKIHNKDLETIGQLNDQILELQSTIHKPPTISLLPETTGLIQPQPIPFFTITPPINLFQTQQEKLSEFISGSNTFFIFLCASIKGKLSIQYPQISEDIITINQSEIHKKLLSDNIPLSGWYQ